MKAKKLTIDVKVPENYFIEWCLNMRYSGYDYTLAFAFYALANHWHINKLKYYLKLIEL